FACLFSGRKRIIVLSLRMGATTVWRWHVRIARLVECLAQRCATRTSGAAYGSGSGRIARGCACRMDARVEQEDPRRGFGDGAYSSYGCDRHLGGGEIV